MSNEVLVAQLTRAMDGVEQARLGYLEAAKALDQMRATVDRRTAQAILSIYRDALFGMDAARDLQSRLTEFVSDEDGHQ